MQQMAASSVADLVRMATTLQIPLARCDGPRARTARCPGTPPVLTGFYADAVGIVTGAMRGAGLGAAQATRYRPVGSWLSVIRTAFLRLRRSPPRQTLSSPYAGDGWIGVRSDIVLGKRRYYHIH